ncbi:MAG: gamma-glutamyl-gamma-aminobutyrate hydrolase family protein [Acidimicrobiales bacterium]
MKQRIGITVSLTIHDARAVEALERAYVDAVLRAGGVPLVLPACDPAEVDAVAGCLDGLLLSGGGDVDPARYGATTSPEVSGVEPERDAWELALVAYALKVGLPILGTCRGAQVLNVAMGGTLVAHLPAVTWNEHCQRDRWSEVVHDVSVQRTSTLSAIVGAEVMGVNSLHHQAVDQVGTGLRAVGWADDGVIEAVEGLGSAPVLGVQWHPELLPGLEGHAALFTWLVDVAGRFRTAAVAPEHLAEAAPLAVAAA